MHEIITKIAENLAARNASAYLVGGYVRDKVMGYPSKDIDIECFNIPLDELEKELSAFGKVELVGKSYGVIKLHLDGDLIDFSVPRTEKKTGTGYQGFDCVINHQLTIEQASKRRDYTINALYQDILTGEIIDPTNGLRDIERKKLRHVGEQFEEDPTRVLRGMQFCSRFGLFPEQNTLALCNSLKNEYETISIERIWEEWKKWALKSVVPSLGLRFLVGSGWISLYSELSGMIGCPQNPKYHPEGSVWIHTLHVCDEMAAICERDNITGDDRVVMMFSALLHDTGKPSTTVVNKDRITAPQHEVASVPLAEKFLNRIGAPHYVFEKVIPLVREHMNRGIKNENAIRRMSVRLGKASINELIRLMEADGSGRPPLPKGMTEELLHIKSVAEGLHVLHNKPEPIVMGRDLISLGISPGPVIGDILTEVYQAQLDGDITTHKEGMNLVRKLMSNQTSAK